jgi:hypothetical protein
MHILRSVRSFGCFTLLSSSNLSLSCQHRSMSNDRSQVKSRSNSGSSATRRAWILTKSRHALVGLQDHDDIGILTLPYGAVESLQYRRSVGLPYFSPRLCIFPHASMCPSALMHSTWIFNGNKLTACIALFFSRRSAIKARRSGEPSGRVLRLSNIP